MDVIAEVDVACDPPVLFGLVDDLSAYPDWLGVVPRVEPAPAERGDPGPAWFVELRGRVGPLARSKRLRMVRSELDPGARVVYVRRELDGRRHASWRLTATVGAVGGGSRLRMELHYGGSFAGPLLRQLLTEEIELARTRLRERAEQPRSPGDGR